MKLCIEVKWGSREKGWERCSSISVSFLKKKKTEVNQKRDEERKRTLFFKDIKHQKERKSIYIAA